MSRLPHTLLSLLLFGLVATGACAVEDDNDRTCDNGGCDERNETDLADGGSDDAFEDHIGPDAMEMPQDGCGSITIAGECQENGTIAAFCDPQQDVVRSIDCSALEGNYSCVIDGDRGAICQE